jgi:hypothetical protein
MRPVGLDTCAYLKRYASGKEGHFILQEKSSSVTANMKALPTRPDLISLFVRRASGPYDMDSQATHSDVWT